jgi:dienelactone hydrolase
VIAAADQLRAAGHTLHTPDYYDGEVFDDLDDGLRKEDALGYQEIVRRAREAVAELPAGLVYAGFSLGAVLAELLAAGRPGVLGAVLMHGAVPVEGLSEFGVERWPEGVPVQVHYAAGDPWVEAEEEVAPLGDTVRGAGAAFEEYAYPGSSQRAFLAGPLPHQPLLATHSILGSLLALFTACCVHRKRLFTGCGVHSSL